MTSVRFRRCKRAATACITAALVAAATITTAGVPAAGAAVLGSTDKATGTPVKVGLISDGKSDAIDNTPEIKAAQAATQYVNQYKGGVAHPIDLDVCVTQDTQGATDCATQMVNDKVGRAYGVTGRASIYRGLKDPTSP
jgi:branched-chain amino acid transport system substrate-binding protein